MEFQLITTSGMKIKIAAESFTDALRIAKADAHQINVMQSQSYQLALHFGNNTEFPHLSNVKPVKVGIHFNNTVEEFYGIKYIVTDTYTASMRCVQDGSKKEGDTYTSERFWLMGRTPKSYDKKVRPAGSGFSEQKYHYRIEGSTDEWFVSCYSTKSDNLFGHTFGLCSITAGFLGDYYSFLKMEVTDTL